MTLGFVCRAGGRDEGFSDGGLGEFRFLLGECRDLSGHTWGNDRWEYHRYKVPLTRDPNSWKQHVRIPGDL